ncbi:MAG: hypothetical protein QM775_10975 [Pirellulales bacterium]
MHLESFFPAMPSQEVPMGSLPPIEDFGPLESVSEFNDESPADRMAAE